MLIPQWIPDSCRSASEGIAKLRTTWRCPISVARVREGCLVWSESPECSAESMSGLELGQQALSYDPQHLSSSDEMPDSINGSLSGSTTGTGRHNLIRKCPSDLHILAKTLRALLEHVRNHICKYIYTSQKECLCIFLWHKPGKYPSTRQFEDDVPFRQVGFVIVSWRVN